jgi:hypothetical protein
MTKKLIICFYAPKGSSLYEMNRKYGTHAKEEKFAKKKKVFERREEKIPRERCGG